jgi:hypothetical protein
MKEMFLQKEKIPSRGVGTIERRRMAAIRNHEVTGVFFVRRHAVEARLSDYLEEDTRARAGQSAVPSAPRLLRQPVYRLDTGMLSAEQINLLLTNLPWT